LTFTSKRYSGAGQSNDLEVRLHFPDRFVAPFFIRLNRPVRTSYPIVGCGRLAVVRFKHCRCEFRFFQGQLSCQLCVSSPSSLGL